MADGDITAIRQLGSFTIPGGGNTLTGVAVQNKVMVWGEITATYVAAGIDLSGAGGVTALGVTTLDFVRFEVSKLDGNEPASQVHFVAALAVDEDRIYLLDNVAGDAKPEDAEVVFLKYLACGDSNAAPELT